MRQMIVKKGSFASCHRISNHKGKCHNLHGHNYNYEIGISYDLEGTRLNECNYVIDFGELKELYTSNIDKFFDHSVIVNENDKDVLELAKKINDPQRVIATIGDPSVEVISQLILWLCFRIFNYYTKSRVISKVFINYIKIYETDNSYCELTVEPNDINKIPVSEQFKHNVDVYL